MEEDYSEQCDLYGDEDDDEWSRPVDLHESTTGKTQKDGNCQTGLQKQSAWPQPTVDHPRVIVHIDVDCFYAQVEMIHNPALKDIPLGIQQKYLVVTCNYPARARGVTKLMGIAEAKKKCPELVLVSGEDLTRYREMSYKISEFLMKYTPNVERLGFDENFLDVTEMVDQRFQGGSAKADVIGHIYSPQDSVDSDSCVNPCSCGCHRHLAVGSQIAADIRSALSIELGITGCAGIAHNKLLAKLVGSQHKPNQQTTMYPCHGLSLVIGLKSARHIPGIGYSTSRRLKALGVETVSDLQQFSRKQLEEEFGVSMATTIHNMAFGIDHSPVVTFGKPQMLSIEDSFRCCNTEKDAMSRVSRLITSLLPRMQEDGRTPHTFRLTVRKASNENRYVHRESRQCNLPSAIAAKISSGQLDVAQKHLVTMAMSLFHKIVDVKQPFLLKLINVAFTRLEETTNNNITAFFTSQSSAQSTSSQDNNEHSDISLCATIKTPQGVKSAANSAVDNTAVNNTKRRHSGNLASFFTKKQKVRETVCDMTESASKVVRRCEDLSQSEAPSAGSCYNAGRVALPADVDPEVFAQLPEEIQQEILGTVPQPCVDKNKDMVGSSVSQENLTRREQVAIPSTSKSFLRNGKCSSESREQTTQDGNFFVQTKKAIFSLKKDKVRDLSHVQSDSPPKERLRPKRDDQTPDSSHSDLDTKHADYLELNNECSSEGQDLEFSPSKQSPENSHTSHFGVKTPDPKFQNLQQKLSVCSKACDANSSPGKSKQKSFIHSIHNPKISVPKGVAPDVFSALPPDLQREVAAEMAIQKQSAAISSGNVLKKSQGKSPAKQANSMLNYLKKR